MTTDTDVKPVDNDSTEATFNTLLSDLKTYRDTVTCEAYVPSLGRELNFKPITVTQQSKIITSLVTQERDSNAFSYSAAINSIILENINETDQISCIDRIPILLQLRVETIGSDIVVDGTSIDLGQLKDSFILTPEDRERITTQHVYTHGDITVKYSTPTLSRETETVTLAEDRWAKMEGTDILTELYIIELSKYVNTVTFSDQTISITDLTFDQQLEVCNALPMKHSRIVVSHIQAMKNLENTFSVVDVDGVDIEVPLNTSLFNTGP